jgi:hypothetical protein
MPSSMAHLVTKQPLDAAPACYREENLNEGVPDRQHEAALSDHAQMQGLRGGLGPPLRHAMF